jgi:hypothetical protein
MARSFIYLTAVLLTLGVPSFGLSQEPAPLSSAITADPPSPTVPAPVGIPAFPVVPFPSPGAAGISPPVQLPGPADSWGDRLSGNHNFANFINWMSNPLFNIDPRAMTAVYPLFGSAWVSNTPPIPNNDMQVYGPAITVALSDRFAMGLNQGGYAALHPSHNPADRQRLFEQDPQGLFRDVETSGERKGWLNLGGFFQYTLIENVEDQFLLTAGLRWEAPAGSYEVFQGHGPLHLAPYVTIGKEFAQYYHVLVTTGYLFPAGPGGDISHVYYADVHLDRQCFGWLYPLVEVNTTTSTAAGNPALLTRRGYVNFGNFEATGNTVTLAAGANAVLIRERLEFGVVYTKLIDSQSDVSMNGLLVKMTLRY